MDHPEERHKLGTDEALVESHHANAVPLCHFLNILMASLGVTSDWLLCLAALRRRL